MTVGDGDDDIDVDGTVFNDAAGRAADFAVPVRLVLSFSA